MRRCPLTDAYMSVSVVGVDLAAGRGITAMATLTVAAPAAESDALTLRSLVHAPDDAAIIAEVMRWEPRVIAIDAPLSLPAPVAAALAGRLPDANASPYTRAAERDQIWSRLGVRPFPVSFLGGLTFRAIPLAARLRDAAPACQIIEVFPSGGLAALGLRKPSTRGQPRPAKTSPEAQRLTQGALARIIAQLPIPREDAPPLDTDSLDAIAAALVAALFSQGHAERIGDEREGNIVMPSAAAASYLGLTT